MPRTKCPQPLDPATRATRCFWMRAVEHVRRAPAMPVDSIPTGRYCRLMASRPPSPKPARGDARRALLEAAHTLVRRKGWAGTSVDELCAEAGVTKGAFFHHFASKEALGVAAAEQWTERARENIFENPM